MGHNFSTSSLYPNLPPQCSSSQSLPSPSPASPLPPPSSVPTTPAPATTMLTSSTTPLPLSTSRHLSTARALRCTTPVPSSPRASQEATHVTFLSTALSGAGATPVKECTYDFGLMSPETFLATAQVLEGVGVAAYLGAAPSISNKAYLAVAGSILVVEAQHETWLRSAADTQDPFPKPFAAPLDFNQVFTLAAPFIKSCPADSPALPFKAFPSVTVNTKGPYKCKETISVEVPKSSGTVYAAFVDATNTQFQDITKSGGKVTIPEGIAGQSYLILTSGPSVKDSATIAGPAIIFVESD